MCGWREETEREREIKREKYIERQVDRIIYIYIYIERERENE